MSAEKCDSNSSCPTCNQTGTCSEEEKEAHDLKRLRGHHVDGEA